MNILITGVCGFLGKATIERLLKKHTIIGIGRKPKSIFPKHIEGNKDFIYIQKDLKDLCIQDFEKIKQIDILIHLASIDENSDFNQENFPLFYNSMIIPILNLIKIVKYFSIKKIVFSSSVSVFGEQNTITSEYSPRLPKTNYACTKILCQHLLEMETKSICLTLYYPGIFGNENNKGFIASLAKMIIKDEDILLYDNGEYLRNMIYIEDAVAAIELCVIKETSRSQSFIVGSKESMKVKDIAKHLITRLNSKSKIILNEEKRSHTFDAYFNLEKSKKIGFQPRCLKDRLSQYVTSLKN